MSEIVLYDYWRSSASYRVRIALGLKDLDWRTVPVDLLGREQRQPDFKARNPQGLVPVLHIDGRDLTQSLAIIEYLDETRPDPALLPADPAARARVRTLSHLIAMEIHPINMLSVLEHIDALTGQGAEARLAWMRHFMPQGLSAFEALLGDPATGRHCHGDTPTLADLCLVPQVYNAARWGIDLTPYPRLRKVVAACEEIAAFAAAHPVCAAGAFTLGSGRAGSSGLGPGPSGADHQLAFRTRRLLCRRCRNLLAESRGSFSAEHEIGFWNQDEAE